jgi:pilus assembly protein Flp/PilA
VGAGGELATRPYAFEEIEMSVLRHSRTRSDERGASAVEYGLLIALIAAVIVVATLAFGGMVKDQFSHTGERYQQPTGGTQSCQ